MKQEILVKVEHMNKRFGSTVALKDVSIEVCSGRVLGLIGENGSGKSTVTSIIAGMQNADSGTMTYHDKEWKPESMLYSLEHGIGMIVQETGTVPGITVAENIFLGETKFFKSFGEKHKWGPVKRKLLNQKAQEALDAIGASHIRAEQMTASLDLQERKLIEIARIMNKHEEYETYKGYEHYVGAIGPSLEVEYQTGYDMANYYLEQGKKNFAIFGGAIPYYTDMHIYRAAGMIAAMVDAGGADANYKGATDEAGIIGQIYADGQIETGAIGDVNIVGYVGGYDMDDAWFGKCAQMAQTPDLEVILAVGNGSDFFGTAIEGTDVKIASVDAYAESYGTAMDGGMLDYLAGKFSASIGPIFIATYRAVLGSPIRTEDGNALALSQGYWVATSPEEFSEYYAVDSSVDSPAYTKGMLDGLLTADYASFEKFVSAYGFKDIQKEAK